jgi:hypothetical protein
MDDSERSDERPLKLPTLIHGSFSVGTHSPLLLPQPTNPLFGLVQVKDTDFELILPSLLGNGGACGSLNWLS